MQVTQWFRVLQPKILHGFRLVKNGGIHSGRIRRLTRGTKYEGAMSEKSCVVIALRKFYFSQYNETSFMRLPKGIGYSESFLSFENGTESVGNR